MRERVGLAVGQAMLNALPKTGAEMVTIKVLVADLVMLADTCYPGSGLRQAFMEAGDIKEKARGKIDYRKVKTELLWRYVIAALFEDVGEEAAAPSLKARGLNIDKISKEAEQRIRLEMVAEANLARGTEGQKKTTFKKYAAAKKKAAKR